MIRAGKRCHMITGDTLILTGEPVASTELVDGLREIAMPVYAVGDCSGLRLIAGATTDALNVVQRINAALR